MYEIFAKLMKANGCTAYQVSKAAGIAQSTLSDWKSGKSVPKADKIQKFVEHEEKPSTTQHAPIIQSDSAPPPKADNGLKCPKCHSHNIDLWADDKISLRQDVGKHCEED